MAGAAWSDEENEATVALWFKLLRIEQISPEEFAFHEVQPQRND